MSEQNGATEQVITEKRSIRMSDFRTKEAQAAAMTGNKTVLGQVVGIVYGAIDKESEQADGSRTKSVLLTGDFEGVSFKTGEVFKSGAAYLPNYFADQIKAAVMKNQGGVSLAVEIVMEPNPKENATIPFQYAVSNLLPPTANDPLQALKRQAAASGRLRLPTLAPGASAPMLEGKAEDAEEAAETAPAEAASAAKPKGKAK